MILDGLTPEELQAVEKLATLGVYKKGALIIEEGEAGTTFFLLISGRVEVRKRIAGGQYKKLIELGPCGVFGEVAFLGVESRSASVIALRDCEVLEFDGKQTERFMNEKPAIGLKLYRGMARELAARLARSDEDIKDAIVWAMGDAKDKVLPIGDKIDVPVRPRLTLDPRRAPPTGKSGPALCN